MPTELQEPKAYGRATKGTGAEIPAIEDDLYTATIKDVKQGQNAYDGEIRDQYVVEFELHDVLKANGDPLTLRGYISIPPGLINDGVVNEKSNLYQFLMALGYTDDTLEVDPAAWQGEELRVVVENKEIKSGDNKGQVRPRITGYKKKKAAAAATPAKRAPAAMPAAADDEDDF